MAMITRRSIQSQKIGEVEFGMRKLDSLFAVSKAVHGSANEWRLHARAAVCMQATSRSRWWASLTGKPR